MRCFPTSMRACCAAAVVAAAGAIAAAPPARAQVMLDMTRVTCANYLAMTPQQSRIFSAWMSGWFNQKSGYAWINLTAYEKNIASVKQWCGFHQNETVMVGLERATTNK